MLLCSAVLSALSNSCCVFDVSDKLNDNDDDDKFNYFLLNSVFRKVKVAHTRLPSVGSRS